MISNWIYQNSFSTTQSPVKFQINYYISKWIFHSCPPSYWMLYSICSWDSVIKLTKKQTQVQQVEISCLFCRLWSAKDYSAEADYWWQWSILWGVSMAGPHSHRRVPVWGRTGQQVVCGHCSALHSQVSNRVLSNIVTLLWNTVLDFVIIQSTLIIFQLLNIYYYKMTSIIQPFVISNANNFWDCEWKF